MLKYLELRYNHNHDSKGRFCSGSGSVETSAKQYKISAKITVETDFTANRSVIDSKDYADKFNGIVVLPNVKQRIVETARESIYENDGTQNETITFLDKWTGAQVGEKFHHEYKGGLTSSGTITIPDADDNSLILVHNHGNSSPFSFDDFYLLNECHEIKTIIAAGHNGTVFKMSVGKGKRLDLFDKNEYNNLDRYFALKYDKSTGDLEAIESLCSSLGWRFEYE